MSAWACHHVRRQIWTCTDDAYEDTTVHVKEISDPLFIAFFLADVNLTSTNRPPVYGDWQELVHPLGGTYFYNFRKNMYTLTNLRNNQGLHTLDKFVDVSQAMAKEDSWLLIVQPMIFMEKEIFQYYYNVSSQVNGGIRGWNLKLNIGNILNSFRMSLDLNTQK
ncbi:hypothetical protein BDR03DRAFT_985708 [Suillus americanus]|nr:hypothetical protein BDR03DRAFT_985708 [Suillus americanus]